MEILWIATTIICTIYTIYNVIDLIRSEKNMEKRLAEYEKSKKLELLKEIEMMEASRKENNNELR